MGKTAQKLIARRRRHRRVRKRVAGTLECPRLAVYKSLRHVYAQLIDDDAGHTLVAASTLEKDVANGLPSGATVQAAAAVGRAVARKALQKGIAQVVFDRGGYPYHGRVKALADAVREAGLQF